MWWWCLKQNTKSTTSITWWCGCELPSPPWPCVPPGGEMKKYITWNVRNPLLSNPAWAQWPLVLACVFLPRQPQRDTDRAVPLTTGSTAAWLKLRRWKITVMLQPLKMPVAGILIFPNVTHRGVAKAASPSVVPHPNSWKVLFSSAWRQLTDGLDDLCVINPPSLSDVEGDFLLVLSCESTQQQSDDGWLILTDFTTENSQIIPIKKKEWVTGWEEKHIDSLFSYLLFILVLDHEPHNTTHWLTIPRSRPLEFGMTMTNWRSYTTHHFNEDPFFIRALYVTVS